MNKLINRVFNTKNRSLIRQLVVTDFKLRYQGSLLGYAWTLLRPLMLFGVLYIVFTHIIKIGNQVPHYPAYLLLGLVLWTFFIEATIGGMNSIAGRSDLVRKVSIPKYTLVIGAIMSAAVNFMLNMLIVLVFMLISHVSITTTILYIPLLFLEMVLLCLGLSLLLAALFVKFRDISHIWEVLCQVLFYATPIIYSMAIVPLKFQKILILNPIAQIIQDTRYSMITKSSVISNNLYNYQIGRIISISIIICILIIGSFYFKKSSKSFAEEI